MARQLATFTTAGAGAGHDFSTITGDMSRLTRTGGVLQTTSNTTVAVRANTRAVSSNQYAQVTLVNDLGTSAGVFLQGTSIDKFYLARHNGTSLTLFRGDGSGTFTTLATVSHTRAAGQVLKATCTITNDVATVKGYINGTELVTADDTRPLRGRYFGIRTTGPTGVQFDNFDGGDIGDTTSGTNPGSPEYAPIRWRGLIQAPGGELVCDGQEVHTLSTDFLGASGAYTPPSWLEVSSGTATLVGPDSSIGYLNLATGATINNTAGLRTTQTFSTTAFTALRIDVGSIFWGSSTPNMEFRMFAAETTAGGGALQINTETNMRLYVNDETTLADPIPWTVRDTSSAKRRDMTLWVICSSKEVFLLEGDRVLGYRDARGSWVDGAVHIGFQTTTKAASAINTRLCSLSIRAYA